MNATPAPNRRAAPAALIILALIGLSVFAHLRFTRLETELQQLGQQQQELLGALKLIRLEGDSEGQGVHAIIEQLRTWAPEMASAATPDPRARWLDERLRLALDAITTLGPDAYPPILHALETESERDRPDDELRKWLLRAAYRADAERGKQLYFGVLRGTRCRPSARLRFVACDDLMLIDEPATAAALSQILQYESAQGIKRQVPSELAPEFERVIGTNQFPQFFNFIARYAATDHDQVEITLLMLIGRAEHDLMTYQACIRELGKLKSTRAVKRIKELFDSPPGRQSSPLFRKECLKAIAAIEGSAACDWFDEKLRSERDQLVASHLQELRKTYCQ